METTLKKALKELYRDDMLTFFAQHPEYFTEAIELAMGDENPYCWRAAWLIFGCMEQNDHRIRAYVPEFIRILPEKQGGHQRELLKILDKMEISEQLEGVLFDHCVNIWEKIAGIPSARYFAIRTIIGMAAKYPELSKEVYFLTGEHYLETLSPGIRKAILKMLKTPE